MAARIIERGKLLDGGDRAKLSERVSKYRAAFDVGEHAWTAPRNMQVRITDVETADNRVAFFVEGRRAGRVVYRESHVIINPPTRIQTGTDPAGEPVFQENPLAVIREIVERNIR